jgi:hypothetical protein
MSDRLVSVNNYVIAQNSTPQIYVVALDLIATVSQTVDFRPLNLDGQQFWPQGVYYDSLALGGNITFTIDQLPMSFLGYASNAGAIHYPAVSDQTITVVSPATGRLILAFCNFPVMPA